jgi:hypothetical protein
MGNPTVTPLQEAFHEGGFIVSLANGHRSFDQITLLERRQASSWQERFSARPPPA